MKKINFEAGTQVSPAKVTIDDVEHNVTPAVYEGNTPLSPFVLNTLQDNIEKEFQVDKTTISGKTSQEGTPSPTNIVPIKNVNVRNENSFNAKGSNVSYYVRSEKETYIINNSNSITINGIENTWSRVSITITNLKPNTEYTMTSKVINNSKHKVGLLIEDSINNVHDISSDTNPTLKISFITDDNGSITIGLFSNWSATALSETVIFDNIKLEEGTTATTYTPYNYGLLDLNLQKDTDTKTVTLVSKRLHEDDSVDENGLHYKKMTIVYSGTEEVTVNSNFTSTFEIRLPQKSLRGICSHYKSFSSASQLGTADGIYLLSYGVCIITDLRFTKVDDFKAMLSTQYSSGTPVTIEYELATQEDEQFNEINQLAWNTLEDLLINGYTFIDSSSDELQPIITLIEHTANEIYRENVDKFKKLEKKHIYSTEETILGKWIDGKRIYRKVIDFGDLPNTTSKVVAHNILNVNQIINIQAIARLKTSPYSTMILDSCDPDGLKYSTHIAVDKNNITILTGSDRSSLTAFVILEYTKTTD